MPQTFYELLKLSPGHDLKLEDVKSAYRQALLTYHPDKLQQLLITKSPESGAGDDVPTIDLIVEAYSTLSDPAVRKAYDASLKKQQSVAHHGIETFDLEDFVCNDQSNPISWSKTCRCGNPTAYVLSEQDLEKADSEQVGDSNGLKEILIGCRGCSLFIRVTFATSET